MDIESKKEHILRCIKIGMDLVEAQFVSECTVEEMEEIDNDEVFIKKIRNYQALAEYTLLERHEKAMQSQLSEGKTTAAQWKLEHMNPNRWGKEIKVDNTTPMNLNVTMSGEYPKNEK